MHALHIFKEPFSCSTLIADKNHYQNRMTFRLLVKMKSICDIPEQDSLEKLLVSFRVAGPVLLNFLIQKVLQCEGVVSCI